MRSNRLETTVHRCIRPGCGRPDEQPSLWAWRWTYILECADGSYYVGSTIDLDRRLWQHNHDPDGPVYTRHRRPVRVVWSAQYDSVEQAFWYEKQIQGWSRRKREALIRGDFELLPGLARRRTSSTDRWFRDRR